MVVISHFQVLSLFYPRSLLVWWGHFNIDIDAFPRGDSLVLSAIFHLGFEIGFLDVGWRVRWNVPHPELRSADKCCQRALPWIATCVSLRVKFSEWKVFLHRLLSWLQVLFSPFSKDSFSFSCKTSIQEADALASWAWASADWFEWTLSSTIVDQYYFSLRPSLDLKYQRATAPIPTTRIAISMITPFQNQDDMLKNTINLMTS